MLKQTQKTLLLLILVFGLSSMNFAESKEVPEMPQDIIFVKTTTTVSGDAETVVTPEIKYNNDGYELLASYSLNPPERIDLEHIDYNKYSVGYYYVVAVNNAVNIRQKATVDSPVVKSLGLYGKMNVFEQVKGQYFAKSNSDAWYHVYWYEDDVIKTGYVYSSIVSFRQFKFDDALAQIEHLESFYNSAKQTGRISNYKNYNGWAPKINGADTDAYGNKRDQAAPLYASNDTSGAFRYILDGQIFDILDSSGELYYVYVPYYDAYGYIPNKYVSTSNAVKTLKQAIFVDIKDQNIFTLELVDDKWTVKSLSYATSGKEAEYKEKTVPGYYAAIQKKDKFLYLDDVTKEIDGYAPFAIRFNGGAYLHGFPVTYKWVTEQQLVSDAEYDQEGTLIKEAVYEDIRIGGPIDPGHIEYSYTLGTIPLSHKCVRNPTSHAEFMYDWITLDQSVIIISE